MYEMLMVFAFWHMVFSHNTYFGPGTGGSSVNGQNTTILSWMVAKANKYSGVLCETM